LLSLADYQSARQLLAILGVGYNAANWWQLEKMNKTSLLNNAYQLYKDQIASWDRKITEVREVIKERKQLNVQQAQKNSSDDPVTILKVRFARGEIDKNQYEEMLRLLTQNIDDLRVS
jgi:hypothetical protein